MIYLTGLLLLLLWLVCGRHGWVIFGSLVGSFVTLMLLVMLIADEFNPVVVGVILAVVLVYWAIYPNTPNPQVRRTALICTLMTLLLLLALAFVFIYGTFSYGFASEDTEEIEQFVTSIGISFPQIQVIVVLLSSLGAVAEASIAISAGMWELISYQPQISARRLWAAGLSLSRKNLITAFNTLLFGFFGSYLTLGLWFLQLHYAPVKIINNVIVSTAVVELVLAFGGILLVMLLVNGYIIWQRRHQTR